MVTVRRGELLHEFTMARLLISTAAPFNANTSDGVVPKSQRFSLPSIELYVIFIVLHVGGGGYIPRYGPWLDFSEPRTVCKASKEFYQKSVYLRLEDRMLPTDRTASICCKGRSKKEEWTAAMLVGGMGGDEGG